MAYLTSTGPNTGSILWSHGFSALGVLASRDDRLPIGNAREVGWGPGGISLWRLTIHDAELPGLWIVVDREVRPAPAKEDGRSPRRIEVAVAPPCPAVKRPWNVAGTPCPRTAHGDVPRGNPPAWNDR